MIGFLFFAVVAYSMLPNINEYDPILRESFENEIHYIYPKFSTLGYTYLVVLKFVEMFLYGALSAIPAFVMTGFIKSKYLIICVPFFLKYMITQTYLKFKSQIMLDNDINDKLLDIVNITDLNQISFLFSKGTDMWKSLLFYTILTILAFFIYCIIRNRRIDYGE